MRGYRFTTDHRLPERDLYDLADALAIQLHDLLGPRVYMLPRPDIAELLMPYVDDIAPEDQRDLVWLVWHLFQDAREMEEEDYEE